MHGCIVYGIMCTHLFVWGLGVPLAIPLAMWRFISFMCALLSSDG
jgi:hypothetical protein